MNVSIFDVVSNAFRGLPIYSNVFNETVVSNFFLNSFLELDKDVETLYQKLQENYCLKNLKIVLENVNEICVKFHEYLQGLSFNLTMDENHHETSNLERAMGEEFWECLFNIDSQPRKIIVSLFVLMRKGNMPNSCSDERKLSMTAFSVYFALLSIKGSEAYRIFHPGIMQEFFKSTLYRDANLHERKKLLKHTLSTLTKTLSVFSFRSHQEEMSELIKCLVSLAMEHVENSDYTITSPTIMGLSFQALALCGSNIHGSPNKLYMEVSETLLNTVNEIFGEKKLSTKEKFQLERIRNFINYLINAYKDAILPIKVLYQQLCMRVSDKTDFREKTAQFALDLIFNFPPLIFSELMMWTILLSTQKDINCRLVALDILSLLFQSGEKIAQIQCFQSLTPLKIIPYIFIRCKDKSSTVIVKALTILAQQNVLYFITTVFQKKADQSYDPMEIDEPVSKTLLHKKLMKYVKRLCTHDKVFVRKSAMCALQNIMCLSKDEPKSDLFSIIGTFTRDCSVLVRKQACVSIVAILQVHEHSFFAQDLFIKNLTPLLNDCETSVEDKCLEQLKEVILKGILNDQREIWSLLKRFCQEDLREYQSYLAKAFRLWVSNGSIKAQLIEKLKKKINTENDCVVWMLLSHLTACKDFPNYDYLFVLQAWREKKKKIEEIEPNVMKNIIEIIGNCSKKLPKKAIENMLDYFQNDVSEFTLPLVAVTPTVEAIKKMLSSTNSNKYRMSNMEHTFAVQTIKKCDVLFDEYFVDSKPLVRDSQETAALKIIETYKVMSQIAPLIVTEKTEICMSLMAMGCGNENVRKIAILALGSFCLQNEKLARDSILLFIGQLTQTNKPNVIINFLTVLCDFCIRYPSMIEPYLPTITNFLGHDSVFVCHQSLILLTRLLQEQYLKLKGSIFFRMLSLIAHRNEELASYAKMVMKHLTKNSVILVNFFAETICFFNGFEKSIVSELDEQNEKFCLKGDKNFDKRKAIYLFMLSNLTPVQKFIKINVALTIHIVSRFIAKEVTLDAQNGSVIKDALYLLGCDEMKVSFSSNQDENVLTKKHRSTIVEKVISVVIKLRPVLRQTPLLKDFKHFLKEYTKDFKNEIKDLLASDPTLAKELEFDFIREENGVSSTSSDSD